MRRTRFLLFLAVGLAGCAADAPAPPATAEMDSSAVHAASPGTEASDGTDNVEPGEPGPGGDVPALHPVVTPDDRTPPPSGPAGEGGGSAEGARRTAPAPVRIPAADERPRFERPEHVRGIYLNAWAAGSARRSEQLIDLARRTEVNTFVIDIKDASGYVSHATGVEAARAVGATGEIRIRDLPGLLRRLEAEGIYPIARIVIVKDPLLVAARPDLAVQDTAGGVWVDSKGIRWLNLFDVRVQDYHIALAREAVELGFPEVQWDYVRFADAPRADIVRASHPGRDGRPLTWAVRSFLERSREELGALGATVTADVFGVSTSAGDVGIGQVWEEFIDVVDVALPMVYPSHYWRGSFGVQKPNAHPYEIVRHALARAVERSARVEGAGATVPWLQDFSLGEPSYGGPEVRAQIQATYDVGIHEWILWNAGSRYTEEALMPVGGWREEPLIRVAGRLVPASERHEALRLARAEEAEPAKGGDESAVPGEDLPRMLDADSLREAVEKMRKARDTLRLKPDSISGG